mgnify:CR=1 FL=1
MPSRAFPLSLLLISPFLVGANTPASLDLPSDAETLVFALTQVQDGFTLLLRNPKDSATAALPRVSWQPAGAATLTESR